MNGEENELGVSHKYTSSEILKRQDIDLEQIYALIKMGIERGNHVRYLYDYVFPVLLKCQGIDLEQIYDLIESGIEKGNDVAILYRNVFPELLKRQGIDLEKIYAWIEKGIEQGDYVDILNDYVLSELLKLQDVNAEKIYPFYRAMVEKCDLDFICEKILPKLVSEECSFNNISYVVELVEKVIEHENIVLKHLISILSILEDPFVLKDFLRKNDAESLIRKIFQKLAQKKQSEDSDYLLQFLNFKPYEVNSLLSIFLSSLLNIRIDKITNKQDFKNKFWTAITGEGNLESEDQRIRQLYEQLIEEILEEENLKTYKNKTKDYQFERISFWDIFLKFFVYKLSYNPVYKKIILNAQGILDIISVFFMPISQGNIRKSYVLQLLERELGSLQEHPMGNKPCEDTKFQELGLQYEIRKKEEGKRFEIRLREVPEGSLYHIFSGLIANACYFGREIPPNIDVVNIETRKSKNHPYRVVGNFLVIKTEINLNEENCKTVILRAINPSETFVKKINVKDLLDSIIRYCQRKYPNFKIAIIRDGIGQASTNRQEVSLALRQIEVGNDPLSVSPDINFNGYTLQKIVFLVSEEREVEMEG